MRNDEIKPALKKYKRIVITIKKTMGYRYSCLIEVGYWYLLFNKPDRAFELFNNMPTLFYLSYCFLKHPVFWDP